MEKSHVQDVVTEVSKKKFIDDFRKSKPELHMLYTKWAVKHLFAIDKSIDKLYDFNNINLLDIIEVMIEEKNKLISENAAYADAFEILKSIKEEETE